jgi:hypothetical protein
MYEKVAAKIPAVIINATLVEQQLVTLVLIRKNGFIGFVWLSATVSIF